MRSLSFTADASAISRLARAGIGLVDLLDEEGNASGSSRWLYIPVQGSTAR